MNHSFADMPVEYVMHGRVSEKTDAFSYGVILLELLTNEKPYDARWAFVEDCEDTLEAAVMEHEGTFALRWPAEVLAALAGVAARCCTSSSHRARTTIAAELPALERLCESVPQMHDPYASLGQQQQQ